MNDTDVVALVERTWRDAQPDRRFAALRNLRIAIPPALIGLYEALLDAKLANVKDDPSATVLFLIHGIQTDGAWQRLVQREFRDVPSINVIDLGYDCVTPAQLVGPFR